MRSSQTVRFQVRGSAPEPYDVTFEHRGSNLTARCTCAAGVRHQYCKHRSRILEGDAKDVVSGNGEQVAVVASWLPGSDVQAAMQECAHAEAQLQKAKDEVGRARKRLARVLED